MDVQEEEDAVKSPTASKGKSGRKSKANSDTKSKISHINLYMEVIHKLMI